ncbi:MAG: anthranilate phosphoribosyltransferase [Dehalococcoidia bacterium]|nr:anthranilate phosphoribosyltransferase [Dehalococcoidia bacterium]
MIREAIAKLIEKKNLTSEEAEAVMQQIMLGEATPSQIGAFLIALRMKKETPEEIAACARVMRAHAIKVETRQNPVVDTCGTGGDGSGTFNVSTVVAFVVAGAGVAVAKHGNRSVSSRCGSADVLEALGAQIELGPDEIARCLDEIGIGFLFAPRLHPAMKYAATPRREIGVRTIFNLLGPLTNPASASIQLLGVYDPTLTETMAEVLGLLGVHGALVVHGAGGLDELSTTGAGKITQLQEGKITTYYVDPQEFGLPLAEPASLKGGLPEENARIARDLLQGEKGARRDTVLLNAAAALLAAGKVTDFREGLSLAAESIDSGKALHKLEQFIHLSRSLGRENDS